MALSLSIGKHTDLGNYRENNEDAIDVKQFPLLTVCVVADGMGGQAAGEVASGKAIDLLPKEILKNLPGQTDTDESKRIIRQSIVQTNGIIMNMASMDRELTNMGTTVVTATWKKGSNQIFIASVGDSRCYLIRNKKIEQLTVDQSIAQALVEAKTITAADARTHRYRNVLWKYLGSKEVGDGPEVKVVDIKAGDCILMCTDGLCGVVPDDQMCSFILEQKDPQQCAEGLVKLALDMGSRDNVSTVVIQVHEA